MKKFKYEEEKARLFKDALEALEEPWNSRRFKESSPLEIATYVAKATGELCSGTRSGQYRWAHRKAAAELMAAAAALYLRHAQDVPESRDDK